MIRHPLERAYRLLAEGLQQDNRNKIQMASVIEAQNTYVGNDNILGFSTLPYSHPRVELSLEMEKEESCDWDSAVAEAVDAIQILKV